MELKDTIEGMTSKDYKERFKAEHKQLTIRLVKLYDTIRKYYRHELDFELSTPIQTLELQAATMINYKNLLEQRAEYEGINLD